MFFKNKPSLPTFFFNVDLMNLVNPVDADNQVPTQYFVFSNFLKVRDNIHNL